MLSLTKEDFGLVLILLNSFFSLNTVLPLADSTTKLCRLLRVRVLFLYSSFLDLCLCCSQGENGVQNHNVLSSCTLKQGRLKNAGSKPG